MRRARHIDSVVQKNNIQKFYGQRDDANAWFATVIDLWMRKNIWAEILLGKRLVGSGSDDERTEEWVREN